MLKSPRVALEKNIYIYFFGGVSCDERRGKGNRWGGAAPFLRWGEGAEAGSVPSSNSLNFSFCF